MVVYKKKAERAFGMAFGLAFGGAFDGGGLCSGEDGAIILDL